MGCHDLRRLRRPGAARLAFRSSTSTVRRSPATGGRTHGFLRGEWWRPQELHGYHGYFRWFNAVLIGKMRLSRMNFRGNYFRTNPHVIAIPADFWYPMNLMAWCQSMSLQCTVSSRTSSYRTLLRWDLWMVSRACCRFEPSIHLIGRPRSLKICWKAFKNLASARNWQISASFLQFSFGIGDHRAYLAETLLYLVPWIPLVLPCTAVRAWIIQCRAPTWTAAMPISCHLLFK